MEELQDAIEDAQYMNAIHDDIPKPIKEWVWPTEEELKKYIDKIKAVNPRSFEAEEFCKLGSLGLYTFMRHCKEQGPCAKVMAEFIDDVATFRMGDSHESTSLASNKIETDYIIEGSGGNIDEPKKKRAPNIVRHLRGQSHGIVPSSTRSSSTPLTSFSGLNRSMYDSDPNLETAKDGSIGPSPVWSEHLDLENAKNAIKVKGEPVARVIGLLKIVNLNSKQEKEGEVMKISMDIFDELDEIVFGYLRDSYFESFKGSFWWSRHYEHLCLTAVKVVEEDFAVFRVLGRGGFGLVNACKKCTTGRLYAMKKLNKKRVKMKSAEPLCLQERNILAIINSPYIVCLKYAFVTHQDLYLILDLMTGGDLGFHLSHKGRFTAKESKYYAARTLLGIAAMHDKSIAYRDLKPENILMDDQGYTKISDLGLACKVGKSGLSGACGTRGYWAPEMLKRDEDGKRERYTLTVDWFSFGCCVYEFMYGMSPFRTDKARRWGEPPVSAKVDPNRPKADREKAIDLATQQMEPDFESRVFDEDSKDLILKLLHKDGKLRLGAKGYKEVIAHPWFASIDWNNLAKAKPPMKPSAKDINTASQSEIGGFEDEKKSKKLVLTEEEHRNYDKWNFISKRSYQEEVVHFLTFEEREGPIKVTTGGTLCCTIA